MVFMPRSSDSRRIGVLWSYDNYGGSEWLHGCRKAIANQGFVWWDVAWSIKFEQFTFPIVGYIWMTREQQVKYTTAIEQESKTLRKPDKTFAREVEANWIQQGLPFGRNDRLHEYLRNERELLTLLKLSEIRELNPPRKLDDFILRNGRPVSHPPQGRCYVFPSY